MWKCANWWSYLLWGKRRYGNLNSPTATRKVFIVQYRYSDGRVVKSALLKGKNRVVDSLVTTVVCTRRVNNAIFPLQQRAFYFRSYSDCHIFFSLRGDSFADYHTLTNTQQICLLLSWLWCQVHFQDNTWQNSACCILGLEPLSFKVHIGISTWQLYNPLIVLTFAMNILRSCSNTTPTCK